jgi:hypothetical protein
LRPTEQGQITERFTRAIEQLRATHDDNSKNLELRLGRIYALERGRSLVHHGGADRLRPRTHALRKTQRQQAEAKEAPSPKDPNQALIKYTGPSPEPDVQAVLTVLGRRSRYFGNGEVTPLDLAQTNLEGANLEGAHLEGANLRQANLVGADLWKANLKRANLRGADLERVSLWEAHPTRTHLWDFHLWRVDLSGSDQLTQEQLQETTGDENTQLPPDLKPPAHWNVKTDEQIEGE